jgi:hypothetical protein
MIFSALVGSLLIFPAPTKVEITGTSGNWKLLRGGKPYFVRGVGGTNRMDEFVSAGGNSMRTWGTEKAAQELDACQAKGLTMMVGIWLGHKSYFDYKNPKQVQEQFEKVKSDVLRLKDHPAVLLWGLGNEMEINNDIPETWMAINDLARMCHQVDPNHPTATVVADISPQKIENIKKYAPDIDVLGVNSYGGMKDLPQRLKAAGWTKPYIVTEFGPNGPWERQKTPWGAALEQTSSEKAAKYESDYKNSVLGQPGFCLGSYAFLWGDKQEETPTWFGMFLPTGERTQAIDVMTQFWSGKAAKNQCPRITDFTSFMSVDPTTDETIFQCSVKATDPDQDPIVYRWEVRDEVADKKYAGENEKRPKGIKGPWLKRNQNSFLHKFVMPAGNYRVYCYITDGKGNAATTNFPFEVK